MAYIHANIEFNDLPLLHGLAKTPIAGTGLIGDADIDSAGRVMCVRLSAARRGDDDLIIERGSAMWEQIFASVEIGCADEIDAATADPDETWDSFVKEHALRVHEVL